MIAASLLAALVAAYGFNEGSGVAVADSSGRGNTGTVTAATWTAGHASGGLSFNGTNATVAVSDSTSLHLGAMTLEAWVYPRSISGWRTVVMKERSGGLAWAIYGVTDSGRPSAEITAGGKTDVRGAAPLPVGAWSHVAATYDGATVRLYVGAVQVASGAATGALAASTGPLRIGGNAVWGEYFDGVIDDVRVYDSALTAAQIAIDRDTPVGGSTPPPVACAWMPSFDSVGAACSPANQEIECRCGECFSWADASGPGLTRSYTISRTDPAGVVSVGFLKSGINDDGSLDPAPAVWCPVKHDLSMALEGKRYSYSVAACGEDGCSAPSVSIVYVAAPYAINAFRPPVKGN